MTEHQQNPYEPMGEGGDVDTGDKAVPAEAANDVAVAAQEVREENPTKAFQQPEDDGVPPTSADGTVGGDTDEPGSDTQDDSSADQSADKVDATTPGTDEPGNDNPDATAAEDVSPANAKESADAKAEKADAAVAEPDTKPVDKKADKPAKGEK
jgi:hypothetical protein